MSVTAAAARATLQLPSEEATTALARTLAARVGAGDTLLLEGALGTGKTVFARALIQARLDAPEEVPSPTYTLVQTYAARSGEIWHCDLFRLTDAAEAHELGLEEAVATALCLVEWPERLGDAAPAAALRLTFAPGAAETQRTVTLQGDAARWSPVIAELQRSRGAA